MKLSKKKDNKLKMRKNNLQRFLLTWLIFLGLK